MKKNYILSFVIVLLITIAIIGISQLNVIGGEDEYLDFCSTEQECINYLINDGMPEDWLEENNIKIKCNQGECYATK